MSVFEGQRLVSIRKRIVAYCEQHDIDIPKTFDSFNILYPIALVDASAPRKHRLIAKTFHSANSALEYLKDQNKHPANYRILDFKRGIEFVLADEIRLEQGPSFDNRKDVDIVRAFDTRLPSNHRDTPKNDRNPDTPDWSIDGR
jgi:hypothetical protein